MERKSGSIRHSFEHQMLRDYYMKNPTDFVDTMGRDGTLFRVYDSVCREHGEENSYRPEQYSADLLTAPDGTKALRLTMPMPQESPECCRIYVFYDETGMNPGYFTIEKCREDAGQDHFVCRWLQIEGQPMMYMILADAGDKDEFEHVADLYGSHTASELYQMLEEAKTKAKPFPEEEAKRFREALSA